MISIRIRPAEARDVQAIAEFKNDFFSSGDRPYQRQMWCSMIRFRHKLAFS